MLPVNRLRTWTISKYFLLSLKVAGNKLSFQEKAPKCEGMHRERSMTYGNSGRSFGAYEARIPVNVHLDTLRVYLDRQRAPG